MKKFLAGFSAGMIVALFVAEVADPKPRLECIKHHAAHFDPQTGAFTWNDEVKP